MASIEVSIRSHDHGKFVDEKRNRVKCNYCGKVVSGFSRLKCHLGGIRGDVTPCDQVPWNVKELMSNHMLEKKKGALGKEIKEPQHPELPLKRNWGESSTTGVKSAKIENSKVNGSWDEKHVKVDALSEGSFVEPDRKIHPQAAKHSRGEDSLSVQVKKCIGRFFFETCLDLRAAEYPSFHRMMTAADGTHRISFHVPSCMELNGWILQDEVKEIKQYVDDIRRSWASTGCSILLDGWGDAKGRKLINILVDNPQGVVYLRSVDISASYGDVNALFSLFEEVIQEVGVGNVVQVVSYSAADCFRTVGRLLVAKYRSIFWTVSASHCLELMLRKIEVLDTVQEVLEKAKTLTQFIYNHAAVLELLRNHTDGRDLFKPSKIRTISRFLTLENISLEEENLKEMFSSTEWNNSIWASTAEGRKVINVVRDPTFWSGAIYVSGAAIPLVRVWCLLITDEKDKVGYIYETIDQAKETISEGLNGREDVYMPLWQLIDSIWNNYLHCHLHSAGYTFNPSFRYSGEFCFDDEVGQGFVFCIVCIGREQHMQQILLNQFDLYREHIGIFRVGGEAMKNRDRYPPEVWWARYGGHVPELQRFAIRIVSQTCNGASKYRFNRALAEKLLTKGRNCIEQKRLEDLTFVIYNMHLKNFKSGIDYDDMDEEIDWMHDWIANEVQDSVYHNDDSGWLDLDSGIATAGAGEVSNGEGTLKEERSRNR